MFRSLNFDTVNILLPHNNLYDFSVVVIVLIDPVRNIGCLLFKLVYQYLLNFEHV